MRICILLLLVACHFSTTAFAGKYIEPSEKDIEQAQKTFKFSGQWIHPKIVHEFLPWESDYSLPLVVAVDVGAATGTNRYFGEIKAANNTVTYEDDGGVVKSYQWIGRLKNGLHILLTKESGSGTMVATDLAVFDLRKNLAVDADGKKYRRLMLEIKRIITIGDRGDASININGNTVDVDVKCNKSCSPKHFAIQF